MSINSSDFFESSEESVPASTSEESSSTSSKCCSQGDSDSESETHPCLQHSPSDFVFKQGSDCQDSVKLDVHNSVFVNGLNNSSKDSGNEDDDIFNISLFTSDQDTASRKSSTVSSNRRKKSNLKNLRGRYFDSENTPLISAEDHRSSRGNTNNCRSGVESNNRYHKVLLRRSASLDSIFKYSSFKKLKDFRNSPYQRLLIPTLSRSSPLAVFFSNRGPITPRKRIADFETFNDLNNQSYINFTSSPSVQFSHSCGTEETSKAVQFSSTHPSPHCPHFDESKQLSHFQQGYQGHVCSRPACSRKLSLSLSKNDTYKSPKNQLEPLKNQHVTAKTQYDAHQSQHDTSKGQHDTPESHTGTSKIEHITSDSQHDTSNSQLDTLRSLHVTSDNSHTSVYQFPPACGEQLNCSIHENPSNFKSKSAALAIVNSNSRNPSNKIPTNIVSVFGYVDKQASPNLHQTQSAPRGTSPPQVVVPKHKATATSELLNQPKKNMIHSSVACEQNSHKEIGFLQTFPDTKNDCPVWAKQSLSASVTGIVLNSKASPTSFAADPHFTDISKENFRVSHPQKSEPLCTNSIMPLKLTPQIHGGYQILTENIRDKGLHSDRSVNTDHTICTKFTHQPQTWASNSLCECQKTFSILTNTTRHGQNTFPSSSTNSVQRNSQSPHLKLNIVSSGAKLFVCHTDHRNLGNTSDYNQDGNCEEILDIGSEPEMDEHGYKPGMMLSVPMAYFNASIAIADERRNENSMRYSGHSNPNTDNRRKDTNIRYSAHSSANSDHHEYGSLSRSSKSETGLLKSCTETPWSLGFSNRDVPNYSYLCIVATVLNPVFGLIAFLCNHYAQRHYRLHRRVQANNLYFAAITVSTVAIFLTLVGSALIIAQCVVTQNDKPLPANQTSLKSCQDKVFDYDETLKNFFEMDSSLYCMLTKNEKIMDALKRFWLEDHHNKKKQLKQNSDSRSSNSGQTEDVGLVDAAVFKHGSHVVGNTTSEYIKVPQEIIHDETQQSENVVAVIPQQPKSHENNISSLNTVLSSNKGPIIPPKLEEEYERYLKGETQVNLNDMNPIFRGLISFGSPDTSAKRKPTAGTMTSTNSTTAGSNTTESVEIQTAATAASTNTRYKSNLEDSVF